MGCGDAAAHLLIPMQNLECRMQNNGTASRCNKIILHYALCIVHFTTQEVRP